MTSEVEGQGSSRAVTGGTGVNGLNSFIDFYSRKVVSSSDMRKNEA